MPEPSHARARGRNATKRAVFGPQNMASAPHGVRVANSWRASTTPPWAPMMTAHPGDLLAVRMPLDDPCSRLGRVFEIKHWSEETDPAFMRMGLGARSCRRRARRSRIAAVRRMATPNQLRASCPARSEARRECARVVGSVEPTTRESA
jgi:hypothetical protein